MRAAAHRPKKALTAVGGEEDEKAARRTWVNLALLIHGFGSMRLSQEPGRRGGR